MNREPAALIGLISVAVQAALVCLAAFGVPFTDDQQAGIIGGIAAFGTLITALLIRWKVYAPASVETVTPGTDTI